MTVNTQENQVPAQEAQKSNDKEYNFAQIRKQLEQERQGRLQAEQKAAELEKLAKTAQVQRSNDDEDDHSDEPYIDERRLNKRLQKLEKNIDEKIDKKAEEKAAVLIENERRNSYLQANRDFNEMMTPENLNKFAEKHPAIAQGFINMPDTFERQKLVYESMKALKINQKEEPKNDVQAKIDQNRRSPYYQPSGTATPPYGGASDFSPTGQKTAYNKMQELKNRLRLG